MEFHPRAQAFTGHELSELVAIAPDDGAMKMGFHLQGPEVDDVVRAARDLEAGCIEPDTQLTAEENVELLLRTTRLLQLGLEAQYTETESLVSENNDLRNDLRVLEDHNRALDEEVGELRELRDREGMSADARELEYELKDLRRDFEQQSRAYEKQIEQSDRDKQTIDSLEAKLQSADEQLRAKDDEALDLKEQLNRLRDDFDELRGQYAVLTAQGGSKEQQREMGDTIRQQEWKIERLTKDNRALEASNCELRAQLESIKEENLQVSEKILLLDKECHDLRLAAAQADDKAEVLTREKSQLVAQADELRADVAAKMSLLDEFEDRFNRQYRSWEEERISLTAQIEGLRKEARLYVSSKSRGRNAGEGGRSAGSGSADGEDASEADNDEMRPEAQLAVMKHALDEAKENEVLLLEAYEQLEADVGQEVDRALARQAEELSRLNRRVQFLEGHLEAERKQVAVLSEEASTLEGQLADANQRNALYESGVYGLPQAALEIRQLKETVATGEARVKELVLQVNKLSAALEDLSDEAVLLRRKAGLPDKPLDTSGVKLQKDVTIAQLRSVNALLERQVSDLEEERRKLRLEVKFRAKYHGKAALEMGLSPEQLLLMEEYVEQLKGGRLPEERLVTQLQQRIEFLEVRLAEVMAYADIPINMRPALIELNPNSMQPGFSAVAAAGLGQLAAGAGGSFPQQQLPCSQGGDAGHVGVAGGIKATQVELVRGALLCCLKMLRQMSEALAEQRPVSDREYRQFTDGVIDKLIDAERVTTLILKDLAAFSTAAPAAATAAVAAAAAAAAGAAERAAEITQSLRWQQRPAADENFLADAAAEELRDRLKQLAKQVVDLQVSLAQKDAQLQQLAQHKAALETRMGLVGKDAAAVAAAAVAARRGADYVAREQHDELELELGAVKEQLLESLEELNSRERELSEMSAACLRYQSSMAQMSDQVKMLYHDYANNAASWRVECSTAEKQLKKAHAEAADASSKLQVLEQALKVLEAGDQDAIKRQYIDAVRKMAVVQLKHAKLARQLDTSTAAEKSATERLEELQEELQDVSSTCRSRIRWLEQAAADAARRTQQLYCSLQGAAPLEAYQALVEKHSQLARDHRLLLEQIGDAPASSQVDELLAVRQHLAELLPRHDAACDKVAELREKLRQFELPGKLSSKPNSTFISGSGAPVTTPGAGGGSTPAAAEEINLILNQDLVAAVVKLDAANRRLEMAENDKQRINASLLEAQAHAAELEQRLAQVTAELSTSRALEGRLQQRLAASVPAAQLEEMALRLEAAEAAARLEGGAVTELLLRAEEAERKVANLTDRRQRQLADITNLRAAVRELSSQSDVAAQLGKLHTELDHVRAKESLARSALNRSELERLELERQARGLKQQVASLTVWLSVAHDHARWAESELLDSLTRLKLSLSGHVEAWKASHWAAKLEQLKSRNDGLAEGLAAAVRRLATMEDQAQEAQLRSELVEDVQSLLARGVSDVHREAAALKEQQLVLKLEVGKLGRAELLMRQKVDYLERVNAELCELLEKCDAEALNQQGGLQAEKRGLTSRMRQLQEEVVRLQERSSALLAELEELKTVRSHKSALSAADAAGNKGVGAAEAAARVAASSAADKDLLLKQIDSLKEARTEAEHMRQECHHLEAQLERKQAQLEELQVSYDDVLERLKGQSTALLQALNSCSNLSGAADETVLTQLRTVAEAAIRELQSKVKDREEQLAQLAAKLQEHQTAYLAQHAKDRSEIEALNNKLFECGAANIAGMKANIARATAVLAATGDGREEVPYEQLRLLLEERNAELEVARNRLEQREASLEAMRRNYEQQAWQQEGEMQRLTAALAAAPQEDLAAPNTRQALQRMGAEVRLKDERLRQLRGAIKALEGKLAQLLKDKTDLVMQASSWMEQEQLDERLADLHAQKAELAAQLQAAHAELLVARQAASEQDATLCKLSEQLLKEGEAVIKLKTQLAREQGLVKSLKAKANKAMASLPEGSQQQLQFQVVQLQERIAVLEQEQQVSQADLAKQAALNAGLQAKLADQQQPNAHATAQQQQQQQQAQLSVQEQPTGQVSSSFGAGVQPICTQKPADLSAALSASMTLPGTPTDTLRSRGRVYSSSDGSGSVPASHAGGSGNGNRKPSRLSSASGTQNHSSLPATGAAGDSSHSHQTATAAGSPRQDSRPGSTEPIAGFAQQQQQQRGGLSAETSADAVAAKPVGVSYASQQWEEGKQMQARIETLRRKLAKKNEELEALQKECDRRDTLISALKAEKEKSAAALVAAHNKLRRISQEAAAAAPAYKVDAAKLKDYVEKVLQLEAEKDALQLRLSTLEHQQEQQQQQQEQIPEQHSAKQASKLSGSSSKISAAAATAGRGSDAELNQEQELFELRLQKEQAVAAAIRLKQQLLDMFGRDVDRPLSGPDVSLNATAAEAEALISGSSTRALDVDYSGNSSSRGGSAGGGADAAPTHGLSSNSSSASLGGANRMRRNNAGSAAAAAAVAKLSGREAELLTTIANLKAALERAMACSTPNTRYMQEVQRRKAAQQEAERHRVELEKLRPQLAASNATVSELQAANAELRVTLNELKQQLQAGVQFEADCQVAAMAELQQQLTAKHVEIARLKQVVAETEQRLAGLLGSGSSTAAAAAAGNAVQQLAALRSHITALEQENSDLRSELNAFDPAFFDEIEDLKHRHHQLHQKCAAQASLITKLEAQLAAQRVA